MGNLWKNVVERDDAEVQEIAGRVKRELWAESQFGLTPHTA